MWHDVKLHQTGALSILKPLLLCLFLCLKLWRSLINSKRQKASLVYLQYVIYNAKCIMVESYRKRIANNTGNLWILSQLVYVATQLYQIFMKVFLFSVGINDGNAGIHESGSSMEDGSCT